MSNGWENAAIKGLQTCCKNRCLISTKLHFSLITSSKKNTNQDEVCYKNGESVAKNLHVWG